MSKVCTALMKIWIKMGHNPVMAGSAWCKDWKAKHPGNCVGCPQEDNCHDFIEMVVGIMKGTFKEAADG